MKTAGFVRIPKSKSQILFFENETIFGRFSTLRYCLNKWHKNVNLVGHLTTFKFVYDGVNVVESVFIVLACLMNLEKHDVPTFREKNSWVDSMCLMI